MPRFIRFPASAFTDGVLNTGPVSGVVFDGLSGTGDNGTAYRLVNADNVSPVFTPVAPASFAVTPGTFTNEGTGLVTHNIAIPAQVAGTLVVAINHTANFSRDVVSVRAGTGAVQASPMTDGVNIASEGAGGASRLTALYACPCPEGTTNIEIVMSNTAAITVGWWHVLGNFVVTAVRKIAFTTNTAPWSRAISIPTVAGGALFVAGIHRWNTVLDYDASTGFTVNPPPPAASRSPLFGQALSVVTETRAIAVGDTEASIGELAVVAVAIQPGNP